MDEQVGTFPETEAECNKLAFRIVNPENRWYTRPEGTRCVLSNSTHKKFEFIYRLLPGPRSLYIWAISSEIHDLESCEQAFKDFENVFQSDTRVYFSGYYNAHAKVYQHFMYSLAKSKKVSALHLYWIDLAGIVGDALRRGLVDRTAKIKLVFHRGYSLTRSDKLCGWDTRIPHLAGDSVDVLELREVKLTTPVESHQGFGYFFSELPNLRKFKLINVRCVMYRTVFRFGAAALSYCKYLDTLFIRGATSYANSKFTVACFDPITRLILEHKALTRLTLCPRHGSYEVDTYMLGILKATTSRHWKEMGLLTERTSMRPEDITWIFSTFPTLLIRMHATWCDYSPWIREHQFRAYFESLDPETELRHASKKFHESRICNNTTVDTLYSFIKLHEQGSMKIARKLTSADKRKVLAVLARLDDNHY